MKGFEVKKITPKSKFLKMVKLKDSNKMHFDPSVDIIKQYTNEIAEKNRSGSGDQEEQDSELCGICYTEKVDAVFQDCNHCEICAECALRGANLNGICPFCRSVRTC